MRLVCDQSAAAALRTRPLRIAQVPAATERLVELGVSYETIGANLGERVLRRIELLLSFEHLLVAGQALAVSIRRVHNGILEASHGRARSRLRLAQLAEHGESVRDLAQRAQDRAQDRLLELQPRLLHCAMDA